MKPEIDTLQGSISYRYLLSTGIFFVLVVLGVWAYLGFQPLDENDPLAIAREADRLAAHPDDPTKPAGISGVSDEKLASLTENAKALPICIRAVEFSPDDPRRLFELGRVLFLANEDDEAREYLREAAKLGHAGAQAYLGLMEANPETALMIFREAAEQGFAPATEMARKTDEHIKAVQAEICLKADQAAAHPDDPTKPQNVQGVSDLALSSEDALVNAIEASTAAITLFPDNPRYRFQLGRALFIAGHDEAKSHLEFAAQKEHGGALYYLAQMQDDAFEAMGYLRKSISAGFLPAKALLSKMEAEIGPDFEGDGYYFGDLFRALFDQNKEYLNIDLWLNLNYSEMMNDSFKKTAPELYSPGLSESITRHKQAITTKVERAKAAAYAMRLFAPGLADEIKLPPLLPESRAYIEKDVERLISTYGKDGTIPKRISAGLMTIND